MVYTGLCGKNYFCHSSETESDSKILNLGDFHDGVSKDTNWMTFLILGAPRVTT
jgi:hypothetical protein